MACLSPGQLPGGPGASPGPYLGHLRELTAALSAQEPLESACPRILQRVAGALNATTAAILLNEGEGSLRQVASVGDAQGTTRELIETSAAWVARTGDPMLVPDGQIRLEPLGEGKATHHVLALPVAPAGRPPSVLVLLREVGSRPFDGTEFAVVAAGVAELALALERRHGELVLAARTDEATLAQRQLEAYALDIRRTFAAEKRRAEELAAALTELRETYLATVHGLAIAVEAKDALTAGHIARVTRYGLALLRRVLPREAADPVYEYGFLLHDIGKLSVPDAILGKEGPLTDEEWTIMRLHPDSGRRILEGIPFLNKAKEMVYTHHERWDGKGYPRGLKGEEIPVEARLFPVVDSYDAMTSDRPYRRAMPVDQALAELERGSGSQFWPEAVEAFLSVSVDQLEAIRHGPSEWIPQQSL